MTHRVKFARSLTAALASVLLLLGLAACGGESPSPPTASATQAGLPVGTPTPERGSETPGAVQTIGVGETGTIDGVKITFDGIRRTSEGAIPPSSGYEYIVLKLTYENGTDGQVIVGSYGDEVTVTDSAGNEYRDTGMAIVEGNNLAIDAIFLAPGDKQIGELALEVPVDATGLLVDYELITANGRGLLKLKLDR